MKALFWNINARPAEPEKLLNMMMYIIGEQLVYNNQAAIESWWNVNTTIDILIDDCLMATSYGYQT